MPGEIRFTAVRFEGREQVETQQVGRRVSETSAAPQAKTTCRCARGKKKSVGFRLSWHVALGIRPALILKRNVCETMLAKVIMIFIVICDGFSISCQQAEARLICVFATTQHATARWVMSFGHRKAPLRDASVTATRVLLRHEAILGHQPTITWCCHVLPLFVPAAAWYQSVGLSKLRRLCTPGSHAGNHGEVKLEWSSSCWPTFVTLSCQRAVALVISWFISRISNLKSVSIKPSPSPVWVNRKKVYTMVYTPKVPW